MALDQSTRRAPVRRRAVEESAYLCGEVILQAPDLPQFFAIGKIDDPARHAFALLSIVVVRPDGEPLYTLDEWLDISSEGDAARSECMRLVARVREFVSGDAVGNA